MKANIIGAGGPQKSDLVGFMTERGSVSINMQTGITSPLGRFGVPFLEITMPCGEHEVFTIEDLPDDDVPCTCGDLQHWFIKYGPNKQSRNKRLRGESKGGDE